MSQFENSGSQISSSLFDDFFPHNSGLHLRQPGSQSLVICLLQDWKLNIKIYGKKKQVEFDYVGFSRLKICFFSLKHLT